ncbi:Lipoxygenase [Atractiella rhizophila]|nr:Lipoxygenase [Atractiella rhizophila]
MTVSSLLPALLTLPLSALAQATPYSLPTGSSNVAARAEAIATLRQNFNYGPDVAGNGSFYPQGSYAAELIKNMTDAFFGEHLPWVTQCRSEAQAAAVAVIQGGGLNTYEDYATKLYDGLWKNTIPDGVSPGMRTNYTSDLLFSMERLSVQPYSVRRVQKGETLSFNVDDDSAKKISTFTQKQLQAAGRLFYVDYRDQGDQTLTEGRYAGACDAFFYIHPTSGDFLPLAIRPNNGSPLIYTPLDSENDWQLAKMLFEQNDFWWAQWYHLVATHEVIDIVYEAALRSLSADHPLLAIMNRLAYQTFAYRISAIQTLINVGGPVDNYFAWSGSAAGTYSSKLYWSQAAPWKSNYFKTNLQNRGLVNSKFGPALKSFPFYEDASVIYSAMNDFFDQFVSSYYTSDKALSRDQELQNFIAETVPAGIVDFPTSITRRSDLVDILTHFGYLVSVLHGVLNTNDPVHTTASLPLHPTAFYSPLPTEKGVQDLVPFMPNVTQSVGQITLLGAFNRPFFENGNRTVSEMFDEQELLDRSNAKVRSAAQTFKNRMVAFSKVFKARSFDENGLSQGMPFVWTVLDPLETPFYLTV